jgi:hypothetical protein
MNMCLTHGFKHVVYNVHVFNTCLLYMCITHVAHMFNTYFQNKVNNVHVFNTCLFSMCITRVSHMFNTCIFNLTRLKYVCWKKKLH